MINIKNFLIRLKNPSLDMDFPRWKYLALIAIILIYQINCLILSEVIFQIEVNLASILFLSLIISELLIIYFISKDIILSSIMIFVSIVYLSYFIFLKLSFSGVVPMYFSVGVGYSYALYHNMIPMLVLAVSQAFLKLKKLSILTFFLILLLVTDMFEINRVYPLVLLLVTLCTKLACVLKCNPVTSGGR